MRFHPQAPPSATLERRSASSLSVHLGEGMGAAATGAGGGDGEMAAAAAAAALGCGGRRNWAGAPRHPGARNGAGSLGDRGEGGPAPRWRRRTGGEGGEGGWGRGRQYVGGAPGVVMGPCPDEAEARRGEARERGEEKSWRS